MWGCSTKLDTFLAVVRGTRGTCHEGVQYYTHTQKEILVRITKRIYIIIPWYNVNNKKVIILK
jgi:hypothetical protein